VARIYVHKKIKFNPEGGCNGPVVVVASQDKAKPLGELPTLEYREEMSGAIVLERRGPWFRIKLFSGTGWIRGAAANRYLPLETL
jgi:hypothetical protein